MKAKSLYGQYCPLSMSAEFLCSRWTMLVLRELLFDSSSFNDIARGVPRMSRTLLSKRLKELVELGIVVRSSDIEGKSVNYKLTKAGNALGKVVFSMAQWGQEWLEIEPSVEDIDADLLMWDIRRNTKPYTELPDPFIVQFSLTDVPLKQRNRWLIFERGEVDLCYVDRDYEVDVQIEVTARKLAKVWMGWESFSDAVNSGELILRGDTAFTKITQNWLGESSVAHIKKQPKDLRVA